MGSWQANDVSFTSSLLACEVAVETKSISGVTEPSVIVQVFPNTFQLVIVTVEVGLRPVSRCESNNLLYPPNLA